MKRNLVASAVLLGSIVVACVEVHELSSTSQPLFNLSNGSPAFGDVGVGTMVNHLLVYNPSGSGDDDTVTDITTSGQCNEFTLMGAAPLNTHTGTFRIYHAMLCDNANPLEPPASGSAMGGTCGYNLNAEFHPDSPGAVQCDVTFHYHPTSSGTQMTYMTSLTGNGVQPAALRINPPGPFDLGNVPMNGSSSPTSFDLENYGTSNLTVTDSNSDTTHFHVTPTLTSPHLLDAGSAAVYSVVCTPMGSTGTTLSTALGFSGIATTGSGGSGASAQFTCRGIVTNLSITPNPVVFASTLIGLPPPPKSVTITNNGSAGFLTTSLDTTAMSNGVGLTNPLSSSPIGPGSNANANLTYSAAAQHSGALGYLNVQINTDMQIFQVAINGEAEVGAIATNPTRLDFGPVCTGATTQRDLDVYASDAGSVTISSTTVDPKPPFDVVPGSIAGLAKGNRGNDLIISATATPTTTGDFTGTLTLHTNIPGTPTIDVPMLGTALMGGIGATPGVLHFGEVSMNQISTEQTVVLTNCGTADLSVSSTTFSGTNPDDFVVTSPTTFPVPLALHQSMDFKVAMNPKSFGSKSATLAIVTDSSTSMIALDGRAITDGGGFKPRETYYACAATGTTGAAGAVPIGLALLALRRRRR